MRSFLVCIALLTSCFAPPSAAQDIKPDASEAAARAALSVLGIAATPNETLPSFSFLRATGNTKSLRSTQLRGGYLPFDNGLYIEGLAAYQKYNPVLLFPEIAPGTKVDVTWASVAATVGIGWEFPLPNDWTIRPAGHLSLGHVAGDAFLDGFEVFSIRSDSSQAVDGDLTAFGVGASLSIIREAQIGLWQSEYRIRQTYLEFYPINEPLAGNAEANSNQTNLFTRYRYPLYGVRFFHLPTKLVLDSGLVFYHGDGANVLDTEWLATAGVGIEIETDQTGLPGVRAGRIMLNGVVAEKFDGFSIGLGLRF
ncbi:autotransporter domain-containing protein [Ruegeria lacuscaerulensis]|uniref:autotransporter domain-containing protein n=1 Tax=Ruegeria lacuscaerulensis TaxID=55218 RepID=UPI00147BA762|nr:autotransporter domain-containing protein [Ruegeria lacuscaerulensis]